jgi:hypothetical protein
MPTSQALHVFQIFCIKSRTYTWRKIWLARRPPNYCYNTGRFIMFSVVINIYNKKTKEPTLMELFTATGKLKVFLQLQLFDVCTAGDMAHIHTIFKFMSHTRQHGCIDILHCCNDLCLRVHVAIVGRIECPIIATWPRWPKDTDRCSSEESMQQFWHVCGKNLNIVSMCAVLPVVHTSNFSTCKKNFQFSCGCEQFH